MSLQISRLQQALLANASTVFAVLVGSRCHGTEYCDSDWDIAVWLDPKLDAWARFVEIENLRLQLARALDISVEKIDLIDLFYAGLTMREQAANYGLVLKGGNTLDWSRFLIRTWRELEAFFWNKIYGA